MDASLLKLLSAKSVASQLALKNYPHIRPTVTQCKARALQLFLQLLGETKHGTRGTNLSRLQDALRRPRIRHAAHRPTRILSIDMGIKNLAYSVLEIDDLKVGKIGAKESEKVKGQNEIDGIQDSLQSLPWALDHLKVVAWQRLSLLEALASSPTVPEEQQRGLETGDAGGKVTRKRPRRVSKTAKTLGKEAETADLTDEKSIEHKADYSPLNVARLAFSLIKDVFLPYNISHVLIERQRYRSGGGSAIQEWTVRVNMLESMLISIFETLRQHDGHERPSVHSVSPTQVNDLWLEPETSEPMSTDDEASSVVTPSKPAKSSGKTTKESKIYIVQLLAQKYMTFTRAAERSRDRFLLASKPSAKASSKSGSDRQKRELALERHIDKLAANAREKHRKAVQSDTVHEALRAEDKKLDDLADCMLQGVAWVQWELNRRVLARSMLKETTMDLEAHEEQEGRRHGDVQSLEVWPRKV